MIRLIIVLVLFFPLNGILTGLTDTGCVCDGNVRSSFYHHDDVSCSTSEVISVEEIQEDKEAALGVLATNDVRFSFRCMYLEIQTLEHVCRLQVKAFFYTNLPPPSGLS